MKRVLLVVGLALIATALPAATPGVQAQSVNSIQMLHVIPVGTTPRFADMSERIPATVDAVQGFLHADVGRILRVEPGVTEVAVQDGSAESIRDQLVDLGFDDADTIYLVYAETDGFGGPCGVTLSPFENQARYALLLMASCGGIYPAAANQAQWPFGATYLTLHELIHGLGAVPTCAPNEGNGSHVTDSAFDVIFLGGRTNDEWDNLTLDVNNDDYYGHSIPGCDDVEDSPFWTSPASDVRQCGGVVVTIDMTTGASGIGTAGNDVIFGTSGADIIRGLDGDDTICAGPGDDLVIAGNGDDRVFGAQGDDEIDGGNGHDVLHGNRGNDLLEGGTGADRIFGYADDDTIFGGPGADRLHGNFGDDVINGGSGDDRIFGYGDNDTITGHDGDDLIGGNFGDDTIDGGDGDDVIYGSDGADVVRGGDGADVLDGNSGNDQVFGDAGVDTIDGGIGVDLCDGGPDRDVRASRCEQTVSVP